MLSTTNRIVARLKRWVDWRRWLVYTHRWLGIAGCVLFVAWFFSGIVMMYARMPSLANEERLARAPVLDLSNVAVSPLEAAARAAGYTAEEIHELMRPVGESTEQRLAADLAVDRLQVGMLGDRPVYRFGAGRNQTIIFADDATFFEGVDAEQAVEAARRFAPDLRGPIRYDRYLTEPDQWTLQAGALMPLHRFALDDEAGTHLYVSSQTGEVVLRTTRRERFWAYLGPVTHWVYFTPFRRHGSVWSEFIIWSSLIGCFLCITGLVWGLWRYSPMSRYRLRRVPSQSPYAGYMKWHHYTGLVFGVITLTWTYSGLLSMGPFNWFSTPGLTRQQREASTGGPLRAEFLTLDSMRKAAAALEPAFPVKELDVMQFRGEPFWLAYRAPSAAEAVQWMNNGLLPRAQRPRLEHRYVSAVRPENGAFTRFAENAMHEIAELAMPGVPVQDAVWLQEYDSYYYDARGSRPLPVLRVRYDDPQQTWLYLDPQRGGIVQKNEQTSRLRRWLFQGLHSLDFPFLYYKRPLWDIVVIVLSIGGLALSATTLVPAYRRLRRHGMGIVHRLVPRRTAQLEPRRVERSVRSES